MDYEYLRASNGGGDAPLMKIQKDRTTGSTTITVDNTTNVPNKFIATYGDLGSDGFLVQASARSFRGHLDSGNLIIDAMSPGNIDSGNVAGQVVIIKPNTDATNFIPNLAQVAHNPDGSLRTNIINYMNLLSTIFSGQLQNLANLGTAGGNLKYINLGGIKIMFGTLPVYSVTNNTSLSKTVNLPAGFFSSIDFVIAGQRAPTTSSSQFFYTDTNSDNTILTVSVAQSSGANTTVTPSILLIGS